MNVAPSRRLAYPIPRHTARLLAHNCIFRGCLCTAPLAVLDQALPWVLALEKAHAEIQPTSDAPHGQWCLDQFAEAQA